MDLRLSQRQLGELLRVDESTVYNWEHARTIPLVGKEKQLRRFLKDSE
jgi:transcriptional regulator with XRE-family HTH domain